MSEILHLSNYVHAVRIDRNEIEKIDLVSCKEPKETIGNFISRQERKPDFTFNAGFFAMTTGVPVFNFMDDGVIRSSSTEALYGIKITNGRELSYTTMPKTSPNKEDFMSAYPPLVVNGKATVISIAKEINYLAARTAIGFNDEYFYIVMVDRSADKTLNRPGMRFADLQKVFLDFNCTYAINFDGGGSARLHDKDNKPINNPSENRPVDSVMAIYLNPIAEEVLSLAKSGVIEYQYLWNSILSGNRQCTSSEVLELMQNTITVLKSVKKDGLYRVQVGAFSKYENASNYQKKLKADYGLNGFIVH